MHQWRLSGLVTQSYLTQCINKMVFEGQLPHKNRQLIVLISNGEQSANDFVGVFTF